MESKIYIGQVTHTRLKPANHQFTYPLYYYAFNLAELGELDKQCVGFGYNRWQPVSVYDKDYFPAQAGSIFDKAIAFIEQYTALGPDITKIMLVTTARYFNYVFNPVSFFYCYNARQTLVLILAYVSNTFGESHIYLLQKPHQRTGSDQLHFETSKNFHVSPFFDRQGTYRFAFKPLATKLAINIALVKDEQPVFTATLSGKAQTLSSTSLIQLLGRYPLTALATMPRILWEANKLYFLRRLTVYKRPLAQSDFTIQKKSTATRLQKFCLNLILKLGEQLTAQGNLQGECLMLNLPDQTSTLIGDPTAKKRFQVFVKDYQFFPRLLFSGDIGLGESYMAGEWDTNDLVALLTFLQQHLNNFKDKQRDFLSVGVDMYHRLLHNYRKNSLSGSAKNIEAHYDLSNALYQQFLDETMTYSGAFFESPADSLVEAQQNKLRMIIEKARIESHHHVLEIGCGWGSFAIAAVQQTGCRVTSITISKAQYDLAQKRIAAAGLGGQVEVILGDYRMLQGTYDRIVSIEMLEAVGHQYLPEYFKTCDRLLKPDGVMVLQTITIPDQRYDLYRKRLDWIRKHIFPGGHLPSLQIISRILTDYTQLTIDNVENIGPHYALTLAAWHQRFAKKEQAIRQLGFDEQFCRKWKFYFSYCEVGFATRYLGNLQLVLTRACNPALGLNGYQMVEVEKG